MIWRDSLFASGRCQGMGSLQQGVFSWSLCQNCSLRFLFSLEGTPGRCPLAKLLSSGWQQPEHSPRNHSGGGEWAQTQCRFKKRGLFLVSGRTQTAATLLCFQPVTPLWQQVPSRLSPQRGVPETTGVVLETDNRGGVSSVCVLACLVRKTL